MINIKKIGQVALMAGALVFVSFYANLQQSSEAYAADQSKKAQKADEAAQAALANSTEKYASSSQTMAAQDKALEQAQQAKVAAQQQVDAYKQSAAYTSAQENYKKAEAQRQANIAAAQKDLENYVKSVRDEQDAKVDAAQQKYDDCMKQNGSCADYLVELNKTKAERTNAIADVKNNKEYREYEKKVAAAEVGDSTYASAVTAKAMAEEQAKEYDAAVKAATQEEAAARAERQKAKQEGVTAANEAIEANKAKIAVAEKEKEKAQKKLDKATADVENKCGKDPNSNACQKAKEKMNEASAAVKSANETITTANADINQAQAQKAMLNMDDEMADFDADLNAEFDAQMDAFEAAKDAAAQATAAETKQMTEQQKAATEAQEAATAYDDAVKNYKEAAESLAYWQKECQKNKENESACDNAREAEAYLAEAKATADEAYREKVAKEQTAKEKGAITGDPTEVAKQELAQAKEKVKAAKDNVANLENTLKEAKAACEHSKTLTSKQGQADAEKYCTMQTQLEDQLAAAKEELEQAQLDLDMAQTRLEGLNAINGADEHYDQEYKAFSTAADSGVDSEGRFTGKYIGSIDYSNTGDVFTTLTRRAARILVGLKPIVYVFAGFGLIGFAFMAIFNKISWKWFANIAIGLFLVANMGRLIEYMVYTVEDRELAEAEKPKDFGDHLHGAFADTEYAWVDVVTPYIPPEVISEGTPDTSVQPPAEEEKETDARGFCEAEQKGGGLFGGGGFASCVKDLISAGKKAVDTAKKVQNTVDTVKNTVDSVKYAADNIGAAIDKIGEGNLEDSFNALSQIGKNVNYIVGSTGGMMNNVMSNTMDIANNVQDISKSRDEQAELQARRDRGEATGGFTAALMGQKVTRDEDGKVTGVEHRWGGELEYDKDGNVVVKQSGFDDSGKAIEGDIASNKKNMQNTGQLGFMDVANDVVQKSGEINQKFNEASQTAGALVGTVANFSAFGSKTINEGRQERQAEKKAAASQSATTKAVEAETQVPQASDVKGVVINRQPAMVEKSEGASILPTNKAVDVSNSVEASVSATSGARGNPVTNAAQIRENYAKAERVATEAAEIAKSKTQLAENLQLSATKATQEAKTVSEKARAAALQKQANLAKIDASQAVETAEKAKQPLSELAQKVQTATQEENKYLQAQASQEESSAEQNIQARRSAVSNAEEARDAAAKDLQRLIQAYDAGDRSQEMLSALEKARDSYVATEKEYQNTQTALEKEIKRLNSTNSLYNETSSLQQELEVN